MLYGLVKRFLEVPCSIHDHSIIRMWASGIAVSMHICQGKCYEVNTNPCRRPVKRMANCTGKWFPWYLEHCLNHTKFSPLILSSNNNIDLGWWFLIIFVIVSVKSCTIKIHFHTICLFSVGMFYVSISSL